MAAAPDNRQVPGPNLRVTVTDVDDVRAALDEIAPLDLDELIAHYSRAASKLEQFCGSSGSGWERAARVLVDSDEPGGVDWWEAAARSES
jgi:hypothetical protein